MIINKHPELNPAPAHTVSEKSLSMPSFEPGSKEEDYIAFLLRVPKCTYLLIKF